MAGVSPRLPCRGSFPRELARCSTGRCNRGGGCSGNRVVSRSAAIALGAGGGGPRSRRPVVGWHPSAGARPELSRRPHRPTRGGTSDRHGSGEPIAVRAQGGGHRDAVQRHRHSGARASGAACRSRASTGIRARSPGAPGRPAWARDRLRRTGMARATRDSRRTPRERSVACRRPAGRDRRRRRPAARVDRELARAWHDGRAPLAARRCRARRGRGDRSGAAQGLQGVGPLSPPRRIRARTSS